MKLVLMALSFTICIQNLKGAEVSFTMDDPEVMESLLFSVEERNQKMLDAFAKHKAKAALFVCGMRIDSEAGKKLLKSWDKAKASKKFEGLLRYPGEDGDYEKLEMDKLGL